MDPKFIHPSPTPTPLPSIYYKPGPALRARSTYWNKSVLPLEDLSLAEKANLQITTLTCERTLLKVLTKFRGAEEGRNAVWL